MKKATAFILLMAMLVLSNTASYAGWLIYHKPQLKGSVIDSISKEPIEGAVVVAVYKKHTLVSGPGGGYASIIKGKETLTDKKGDFYFPSYTTVIQPLSIEDHVEFIIYKPGYGSYPGLQTSPPTFVGTEKFFSEEYGMVETVNVDNQPIKYTLGLVELPKLKTKKERLRAMPSTPVDYRSDKLPLLYKFMNEEYRRFGISEIR